MKNTIAQYIQKKHGFKPQPDEVSLQKLRVSRKRLTQIMENTTSKNSPLTAEELIRLMLWLNMEVPKSIKSLIDYDFVAADFEKAGHQFAIN